MTLPRNTAEADKMEPQRLSADVLLGFLVHGSGIKIDSLPYTVRINFQRAREWVRQNQNTVEWSEAVVNFARDNGCNIPPHAGVKSKVD